MRIVRGQLILTVREWYAIAAAGFVSLLIGADNAFCGGKENLALTFAGLSICIFANLYISKIIISNDSWPEVSENE